MLQCFNDRSTRSDRALQGAGVGAVNIVATSPQTRAHPHGRSCLPNQGGKGGAFFNDAALELGGVEPQVVFGLSQDLHDERLTFVAAAVTHHQCPNGGLIVTMSALERGENGKLSGCLHRRLQHDHGVWVVAQRWRGFAAHIEGGDGVVAEALGAG